MVLVFMMFSPDREADFSFLNVVRHFSAGRSSRQLVPARRSGAVG
jgi:hypothetical protein